MVVTLEIPDDLAKRLGGDLSRRALEAFALEELKNGRMHKAELRRLLGLSWHETEAFLKEHEVCDGPTYEEVQRDLADLKELGF